MLFKNVNVNGLNIFYREAGNEAATLLTTWRRLLARQDQAGTRPT
jgi:hypothetical protein